MAVKGQRRRVVVVTLAGLVLVALAASSVLSAPNASADGPGGWWGWWWRHRSSSSGGSATQQPAPAESASSPTASAGTGGDQGGGQVGDQRGGHDGHGAGNVVAKIPAAGPSITDAPGFGSWGSPRVDQNDPVRGAFRTICRYSHMNYDDAVVKPGETGASHLHVYFGNDRADASSTPDTLRTSGGSTCRGGINNRTAYWAPAVVDTSGSRDGTCDTTADNCTAIVPDHALIYYKTGGGGAGEVNQLAGKLVKSLPQGLRMVAGDPTATRLDMSNAWWGCSTSSGITGQQSTIPTGCRSGQWVQMGIKFPQCWNGQPDSASHRDHVVYPQGGRCPSTHSQVLPEITVQVAYRVSGNVAKWRLSSDRPGAQPGASVHSDWMNGWKPEVSQQFLDNCVRKQPSGQFVSCQQEIIGNGRTLEWGGGFEERADSFVSQANNTR